VSSELSSERLGLGNVGEAGTDYAVDGARIEQRGLTSERGEFVAVSAGDSLN
jgi:hypothetical protein